MDEDMRRSLSHPFGRAAMTALLLILALLPVSVQARTSSIARGHRSVEQVVPKVNHIYPIDHWSYVTKMTDANFDNVVNDALENNRTLMVRWISSPECGPCKVQAPTWDRAVRRYKNNQSVLFADVNIQEFPELANRAGVAQQPTIRAFNKVTGPLGMQYSAKAPLRFETISKELTDDHYMMGYIEDARTMSLPCQVDGTNCEDESEKSQAYLARVREAVSRDEQERQLHRLEAMVTRKGLHGDVISWANQRIRLLKSELGSDESVKVATPEYGITAEL